MPELGTKEIVTFAIRYIDTLIGIKKMAAIIILFAFLSIAAGLLHYWILFSITSALFTITVVLLVWGIIESHKERNKMNAIWRFFNGELKFGSQKTQAIFYIPKTNNDPATGYKLGEPFCGACRQRMLRVLPNGVPGCSCSNCGGIITTEGQSYEMFMDAANNEYTRQTNKTLGREPNA